MKKLDAKFKTHKNVLKYIRKGTRYIVRPAIKRRKWINFPSTTQSSRYQIFWI